ncbi:TolC family protein [Myxococcota bacterium]|nr:TolC family protein [Myxococcota bacterium]MBU1431907.1 TolC family protein [Myxococcota bacterium]MBU1897060.1 TolC family protein [Myxococcota bacterium]
MSALLTLALLLQPQGLTLDQATAQALKTSPDLLEVQERVAQAELLIWRAWATLLPRVTLTGQITRNDQEIIFAMPDINGIIAGLTAQAQGLPPPPATAADEMVIQEEWGQQYGLTARVPLFSAQSWPLLKGAQRTVELSQLRARHAENELRHAVAGAFLAARTAEESVGVSKVSVEAAQASLRLAEARLKAGVGLKLEALKAEMEVNEAVAAVADAESSVALAHAGLRALLGLEGEIQLMGDFKPTPPSADLAGLKATALDQRLDLKALEINTRLASLQETLTKTRFLPTVDLTYNYTWASAAGFGGENSSWRLIFGASWTIFEGSDRFAVLKSEASDTRQATLRYAGLRRQIIKEVEAAWIERDRKLRGAAVAEERAALAEEGRRWATKHFEEGLSHKVDLSEAVQALRQAKIAALLAQLQLDLAQLQLQRALGAPPSRP